MDLMKSPISSTIVEDIKTIGNGTSALISYYYFDYKDKHDVRGLLSSILFQLAERSDHCWTILSQLYTSQCSEQPSERALKECLQDMLELPEQATIYVIVDGLDECPDATQIPSHREPVLKFLESLVELRYSNLHICVTSRPEYDIQSALNPLTSKSRRVSLDEEDGQKKDIVNYIHSFVESDFETKKWKPEIKAMVIKMLSDRASGM
jgi:hypothetical protein